MDGGAEYGRQDGGRGGRTRRREAADAERPKVHPQPIRPQVLRRPCIIHYGIPAVTPPVYRTFNYSVIHPFNAYGYYHNGYGQRLFADPFACRCGLPYETVVDVSGQAYRIARPAYLEYPVRGICEGCARPFYPRPVFAYPWTFLPKADLAGPQIVPGPNSAFEPYDPEANVPSTSTNAAPRAKSKPLRFRER